MSFQRIIIKVACSYESAIHTLRGDLWEVYDVIIVMSKIEGILHVFGLSLLNPRSEPGQ